MRALWILENDNIFDENYISENNLKEYINEAIKELRDLKNEINLSIEEIEYALIKPQYADVYLNNAIRFLKSI